MNPRIETNRHRIVGPRRVARTALASAGIALGTLAISGGDVFAREPAPVPPVSVDHLPTAGSDRFGSTTDESAESATVSVPPRTSVASSNNSTRNGLRVVFRRFGIVVIGGLFVLARMGFRRVFGRR